MKNEIKEETNTEIFRKLHLAYHHSPNRFCLSCINIGRKQALVEVEEMINEIRDEDYDDRLGYSPTHDININVLKSKIKEMKK